MKIRHSPFLLFFTLIFMIHIMTFSDVAANTPHIVGGFLQYSDGSHPVSVTWNAYITTRPYEVITQASAGSKYDGSTTGGFAIQCEAFKTQWSAGDVLHADFDAGAGYTASIDITLTNNPGETTGTITLGRESRQITITTEPAGLQIIADGSTYTAPHTFSWQHGTVHTLDVTATQSLGETGVQYTFASWSDTGDKSHSYIVPDSNDTVTASFNTQYQLKIISDYGNPQGGGWYNDGSSVQFSVTTPVTGGTGIQRVFTGWTGSGNGSYTGTQATYTVTMNNPITETAGWKTQFQLTTSINPAGSGSITTNPTGTWFDSSAIVVLDATPNTGYMWGNWSGDLSGTTKPVNLTMNAPKSVTANFGKPVQITINTNPANRQFTADNTTYTSPQTFTWAENSQHNISVTTPQAGSAGMQYAFTSWSPGSSTNPDLTYTVPGTNQTVTANFKTQYRLTVSSVYGNPEGTGWYDAGTDAQFSVTTPVSGGTGTRYEFNGWTGTGTGSYTGSEVTYHVTMNNPITETANWKTQYYLTVNSNYGNPQGHGWYDADATATFFVTSPDVQGDTRYIFQNWMGDYTGTETSHSIIMSAPRQVTVRWKTQHYLTTAENPDEGGDLTPAPPGDWYEKNEVVSLYATVNPGYIWAGWTDSLTGSTRPTSITMDTSKSVTANFAKVSQITVETNIAGFEFTVDDTTYYSNQVFTWIVGSTHTLSTITPQDYNGTPYIFTSWSDGGIQSHTYTVPANDDTVTANFEPREFTLTMVVDPVIGGTTVPAVGSYIYTPGEVVPISATPMQGYRFIYWLGGVDEPDSSSTTVTMNENKNIIAKFIRLGDVRVTTNPEGLRIIVDNDAYISPQDFHWTPGTVHTISIDSTMQYRGSGTRYLYKRWSDDGASTHQITVNEEYIYTAEFQTQYKLTTADAPVNGGTMTPAPPGEWYDVDVHVEVKANPDTLKGYRFTGWTGDLSGNANPDSVLMDGPKNVTANYSRTLNVLITTEPDSLSIYIDEKKYTSPYEFTWEEGSTHTLAADTLKSDGAGKRFVFNTWSDSKPRQHTVTVMSDTVFTAKYIRQYYLSTFVDPVDGGVIIPAAPGVWFEKNSKVELSAIPNSEKDYVFSEWRGALSGSANPDTLTMDAPKSVTAHFRSSDMEAPKLTYLYPANGSHHVPRNEFIQFKVKDAESGINLSTLHFSVNDEIIIKNGVDLTGGFAAVNYSGKNCTVIYDPAEDFKADSTITLNIQCEDLSTAKNKMTSTTSFSIGFSILTYTKKDTLDQRGGAVFDDSTGIVVFVPDSALIDTTIITIGFVSSYPELPEDKRGFPIGIHLGPSGIQFTDSVTITLPYNQALLDSAGVSHPKDFKVYLYSALNGEWTTLKVINADNQNIYVKVLEFCYLVYGKKYTTVSKPNKPVGPTDLHINTQYEFKTSKVLSVLGHPVEYRFDWGDGLKSAWLQDTTSTHIWTIAGEYGIIAMARSRVDTTHLNISDTLHVSVSDVSAIENGNAVPTTFKLSQNYPNPFNPETTIKYQIPQNVYVTMEIYNINGQKIRTLVNEEKSSGYYTIIWDGKNDYNMAVSTGLYFMKMKAGDYVRVIKMSYLK